MKSKLLLAFASFALCFASVSQAKALKDYAGCYKTIKINGQAPSSGNAPVKKTLSTIETGESQFFRTLDREKLNHVVISLYLGSQGNWHSYHPFVLFPKMGTTQVGQGVLTHQMNEDLFFYDNYRETRVDHRIDFKVERLENQTIKGYVSYHSSSRDMRGKKTFLLEKTSCR